ncbi:hypothetical protein ACIPLC_30515 [Kitasatospora sp. NPDC086801]|uniref:hypothetical protein n=1 Tax=Kitasatospora sp. NPDC086801 TaxID=3364066 RepID=UPI00382F8A13
MAVNLSAADVERLRRGSTAVATLGPVGTDAHAVADGLFSDVVLTESFAAAMAYGAQHDTYALVAAGFLERGEADVVDSWVDLHFRSMDRMLLATIWESSTKTMCIATNMRRVDTLDDVRRIAIHPATAVFARKYAPQASIRYANAKPIAVEWADQGEVDACVGSLDVVRKAANLVVQEVFTPTMVWCLYQPRAWGQRGPRDPEPTGPPRSGALH